MGVQQILSVTSINTSRFDCNFPGRSELPEFTDCGSWLIGEGSSLWCSIHSSCMNRSSSSGRKSQWDPHQLCNTHICSLPHQLQASFDSKGLWIVAIGNSEYSKHLSHSTYSNTDWDITGITYKCGQSHTSFFCTSNVFFSTDCIFDILVSSTLPAYVWWKRMQILSFFRSGCYILLGWLPFITSPLTCTQMLMIQKLHRIAQWPHVIPCGQGNCYLCLQIPSSTARSSLCSVHQGSLCATYQNAICP